MALAENSNSRQDYHRWAWRRLYTDRHEDCVPKWRAQGPTLPRVPSFLPPPWSAERFSRAPVIESALLAPAQDLRSPYTWSAGANTTEHASWRDDDQARFNRVCSLEVTAEIDWRTLIVLFRVRRAWLERNSPLFSAIAYRIDDDNEVGGAGHRIFSTRIGRG